MPAHSKQLELASTSTNACRIPIFSPTRRPQAVSAWRVETPWGWAEITGRLGQQHRDLLDAARMVADAEQWTSDGKMHLKVDPAKLRAAMGGDAVNNALIKTWLRDLRAAEVVIYIKEIDKTITGGIISEFEEAADKTDLSSRPGTFKADKPRRYIRISFSSGWSKLIETDRSTKYPLAQVVALRHGFSQAVARFCLSHSAVNDTVAGLAEKLNAQGRTREHRGELRDDAEGLSELGISIDGDQVKRQARTKSGEARSKSGGRGQSPVKTPLYQ